MKASLNEEPALQLEFIISLSHINTQFVVHDLGELRRKAVYNSRMWKEVGKHSRAWVELEERLKARS